MKSNRERKIITEHKVEEYDHECSEIDKWIQILTKFKDEGWERLRLETDYNHSISLELYKDRQETDKEYQERMEVLDKIEKKQREDRKKRKVKIEEEQRALYEKLKKKFEK